MASSKTVNRWHPEEDIELKKLYKSKSVDELAKHFHRSEGSIKSRITKIKHKSIESLNFQLEEYKNLKRYKAHKNNQKYNILASSKTGELWTTEEDIELKKLYKSKSVDELAKHFHRSEGSIKSRLTKIRHKSIQSLNVQLRDERYHKRYKAHKNEKEADVKTRMRKKNPVLNQKTSSQNTGYDGSLIFLVVPLVLFGLVMINGGYEALLSVLIEIIPGTDWDPFAIYGLIFIPASCITLVFSIYERLFPTSSKELRNKNKVVGIFYDLIEWLGGILLWPLVFLYPAAICLIFFGPVFLHNYLGFPWDNYLITYIVIYGSIYLLLNIMANGGISFRRNYNNGNSYDTHANDDQFGDFND